MWPANQTLPAIANAVRAVARYTNSPREVHWKTLVGILENDLFVQVILALQRGNGPELAAYADADYASTATGRRSVCNVPGGMRVLVFEDTEKCATLSTAEAEYVALADTIKEAIFLRYVWSVVVPDLDFTCITVLRTTREQGTWLI